MFKKLLSQLSIAVQKGTSLEGACPPDLFKTVTKNKAVKEATEKLLSVDEKMGLPSLIGRGKNIITLHRGEIWEITMVRQGLFGVEPFLVSAPNPILSFCVGGEGTSKLCFYKIEGDTRALSQAETWRLKVDHITEIRKGTAFSCNDPDMVMDFIELSPTHIFLRFVHKPVVPLLYVFERESKRFSYHTFSDEITTGHYFFSDLLLNMVNHPDCVKNLSPDQTGDLITFCNREIGNEDINMKARWRLLQTLGMVAEEDAVKWLRKFSSHPDPGVSQLAKTTLENVLGPEGSNA